MRRLICAFVVRICHKTRFRMTWPIWSLGQDVGFDCIGSWPSPLTYFDIKRIWLCLLSTLPWNVTVPFFILIWIRVPTKRKSIITLRKYETRSAEIIIAVESIYQKYLFCHMKDILTPFEPFNSEWDLPFPWIPVWVGELTCQISIIMIKRRNLWK